MENSITETVMKNRRYHELMTNLLKSLPDADERLKSCLSCASDGDSHMPLDPASQLQAVNVLWSELSGMQHDVSEFLSCSNDLIAILSILDCLDTPKAHEIKHHMEAIQRLSENTLLEVDRTRSEISEKAEKWKVAEESISKLSDWLHDAEQQLSVDFETDLNYGRLVELIREQEKLVELTIEKQKRAANLMADCEMLGMPASSIESVLKRFELVVDSRHKRLHCLQDVEQKLSLIEKQAASLNVWLSDVSFALQKGADVSETTLERQSIAENICNQRRTKQGDLDRLARELQELISDRMVQVHHGDLRKLVIDLQERWCEMSNQLANYVSSLAIDELDRLKVLSEDASHEEECIAVSDVCCISSELQHYEEKCDKLDEKCRIINHSAEKCHQLLMETCSEISAIEMSDMYRQFADIQHRTQLANQEAKQGMENVKRRVPVACFISRRQTELETWLCDIETEIQMLSDLPSTDKLEELNLHKQSLEVLQNLIADYEPVVDELLAAVDDWSTIDRGSDEPNEVKVVVQMIVDKFSAVKQSVECHAKSILAACHTAAKSHVDEIHDKIEKLYARMLEVDPIMIDTASVRFQISENQECEKLLKLLTVEVEAVTASVAGCELNVDLPSELQDLQHEKMLSKLSTTKQLQSKIEQAVKERSTRLETLLTMAVTVETKLENANGIIATITEFLKSLTLSSIDGTSLPKLLNELQEMEDNLVSARQSVADVCQGNGLTFSLDSSSETFVLPHQQWLIFDVRYDEVMESMRSKTAELELLLSYTHDCENLYEIVSTWLSSAEQQVASWLPIADTVRTVNIQMEELKVFDIKMRQWSLDMDRWSQIITKMRCTTWSSVNGDIDLVTARDVDFSRRWLKMQSAVEKRRVELTTAHIKLGEVDTAMDDISGFAQQVECDLAAYREAYGDPQYIRLQLNKIDAVLKELSNQKKLLDYLSEVARAAVRPAASNSSVAGSENSQSVNSDSSSSVTEYMHREAVYNRKLCEVLELLEEVETTGREARIDLYNRLRQIQGFIDSGTTLIQWFTDWKRDVASRSAIPLGAFVETASRQLQDAMTFCARADEKLLEVQAMLMNGEEMLTRCAENNSKCLTDVLDRLNAVANDVLEKANKYKNRLEGHVQNVELFRHLLQLQIDWLSDAESRLSMLRRPSRLAEKSKQQIEQHQMLMEEIEMHHEPMKRVDLTGTYLKYLGSRSDFYRLADLLMALRLRWKRLIRHAMELEQYLVHAHYENKRFADKWTSLCKWLQDTEQKLLHENLCPASSSSMSRGSLTQLEVMFTAQLPTYLVTCRNGRLLCEQCPKGFECHVERQTLVDMLSTLQTRWNGVKSLITQRKVCDINDLISTRRTADAVTCLTTWIMQAMSYLSEDQPVLGDLDTVKHFIDLHQDFQKEAMLKRELVEKLLMLDSSEPEMPLDGSLSNLTRDWEVMSAMEIKRWDRLQHALKLANNFSESVDTVLQWLPRAEEVLAFRHIPHNEHDILLMIKSHQQFDRELQGQVGFVDELLQVGQEIMSSCDTDAKYAVQNRLSSITARWQQVLRRSSFRRVRLQDALTAVRTTASLIKTLQRWLSRVIEKLKVINEAGTPENMSTVKLLIKQHLLFHEKLASKRSDVERIKRFQLSVNEVSVESIPAAVEVTESKPGSVCQAVEIGMSQLSKLNHSARSIQNSSRRVSDAAAVGSSGSKVREVCGASVNDHVHSESQSPDPAVRLDGGIVDNRPVKASEVVDLWHTAWQMSCTRARRLEDLLQQCKAKMIEKHRTSMGKLHMREDSSVKTSRGDDKIVSSCCRQPLSDLKLTSNGGSNDLYGGDSGYCDSASPQSEVAGQSSYNATSSIHSLYSNISSQSSVPPSCACAGNVEGRTAEKGSGRKGRQDHNCTTRHNHSRSCRSSQKCCPGNTAGNRKKTAIGSSCTDQRSLVAAASSGCVKKPAAKKITNSEKGANEQVRESSGSESSTSITNCVEPLTDVFDAEEYNNTSEFQPVAPRFISRDSQQCRCRSDRPVATDEEICEAVNQELVQCQCVDKFSFTKIDDGKYKYGRRGKMCFMRFINSTVTVRVGGGWMKLDEFLDTVDPCRVRHQRKPFAKQLSDITVTSDAKSANEALMAEGTSYSSGNVSAKSARNSSVYKNSSQVEGCLPSGNSTSPNVVDESSVGTSDQIGSSIKKSDTVDCSSAPAETTPATHPSAIPKSSEESGQQTAPRLPDNEIYSRGRQAMRKPSTESVPKSAVAAVDAGRRSRSRPAVRTPSTAADILNKSSSSQGGSRLPSVRNLLTVRRSQSQSGGRCFPGK